MRGEISDKHLRCKEILKRVVDKIKVHNVIKKVDKVIKRRYNRIMEERFER